MNAKDTVSRIEIGYVSKAHGVRGEMVVMLHDPASTALEEVETVYVGGVARAIVQARNTGGAYLLAVDGITDRDVAASLRGAVVEVDRDELALDDDEVLLADLVGCRCVLADGTAWGEIVAVEMGMQDRLVIRDGNVERQLPVVDAFIADIDVENRVVTVTPPEGLPEDPSLVTRFTVVSILPEIVEQALSHGVVGRARTAGGLDLAFVNPRDFTTDRHRSVDDTPYGGGPGMVMKCEPLVAAIESAVGTTPAHRVLLSPGGRPLDQARVKALAQHEHVVLVCGRYEGVDERVIETAIDEQISLGDFVLTGGELAAACVIDAVSRLMPGVLGDASSAEDESFSSPLLEYPQYTRPATFRERAIPEILAGGNHAAIRAWRRRESLRRTAVRRPDLFAQLRLSKEDEKLAAGLPELDVAARTAVALVHHPVLDRTGARVTTAVTNLDLHDIARSAATYGLAGYHVVTPVESQREKAEHIARLWQEEQKEWRAKALRLCTTAASVDESIAALTRDFGRPPIVAATSADPARFTHATRATPAELLRELQEAPGVPLLILFGTGWGLADAELTQVSRIITPISGRPAWNHLSVRSAVAILLDRLLGLRDP